MVGCDVTSISNLFPCAGRSLAPGTTDKPAHNRPSHYSSQSMLAGEVDYMRKKLGTTLPSDVWAWYMVSPEGVMQGGCGCFGGCLTKSNGLRVNSG